MAAVNRINITDLDNLPAGVTLTGPSGGTVRIGNTFSVDMSTGFSWQIKYQVPAGEAAILPADEIEVSFNVGYVLTEGIWFRFYARGNTEYGSPVPGLLRYIGVGGMEPNRGGEDCNNGVRTKTVGPCTIRMIAMEECYGFTLYFGAVNNDWSAAFGNVTARVIFRYAAANIVSIDPYTPGGTSGPGGGGGSFDSSSGDVDFPALPSLSAVNAGFVSLWVPTPEELQDLAAYMWNTDLTTLDFWRKIVANPMELILSLSIYPTVLDTEDETATVTVGFISTGVRMHYRNSQYLEVDCGSLNIDEYWKAYLDYAPYTRVSIYLPYIGTRPLNTDDVMNKTIRLRYQIDLISGVCVAMIRVDDADHEKVLYQFTGNCATAIPVTSEQMGNLVRAAVSLGMSAGALAGAALTGGAMAAPAGAAVASTANLAAAKPEISYSSSTSSAAGLLSVQRPYLIIERPRQAVPEDQNKYTGYPSFITEELSAISGYTEIEIAHLEGIPCTSEEMAEIERLLREGVIF